MASLTPYDTHLTGYLTDVSLGYRPDGFVPNSIWPVLMVDKFNGAVPRILSDNWLKNYNLGRAFGEAGRGVSFTTVSGGILYRCQNYGVKTIISNELADETDWIGVLQRGVELCQDQAALNIELRLMSKLSTSCGCNTTLSGATAW